MLNRRRQLGATVHEEDDPLRVPGKLFQRGWPPGHFYSPIPSLEEVSRRENEIFGTLPREIPGVFLNEEGQLALFDELARYYDEQPFFAHQIPERRYYFENDYYSYGEGIILYSMIRHMRPRRIFEIGSGHSSCAILDTNELFFGSSIECTFIDPNPARLFSLITSEDHTRLRILEQPVQEVDIEIFSTLRPGDILFIDSSHVSKIDSDVNHIVFQILPKLASGVHVHFHDIYYPFEYPKDWIYQGRVWNEAYLLRAFLQYNQEFSISFFNSFFGHFHKDRLGAKMPLCLQGPGSSLWLTKL